MLIWISDTYASPARYPSPQRAKENTSRGKLPVRTRSLKSISRDYPDHAKPKYSPDTPHIPGRKAPRNLPPKGWSTSSLGTRRRIPAENFQAAQTKSQGGSRSRGVHQERKQRLLQTRRRS